MLCLDIICDSWHRYLYHSTLISHPLILSASVRAFLCTQWNEVKPDLNEATMSYWNQYTWWRHQMETFYWPFVRGIHRSPVNSPHKGQWRGALLFSLICARINGWVNNGEAGDLRRHRAHCGFIVMYHTELHQIKIRPFTSSYVGSNYCL